MRFLFPRSHDYQYVYIIQILNILHNHYKDHYVKLIFQTTTISATWTVLWTWR